MTKLQLAQKRNYFKFVLVGLFKPIDNDVLTEWELEEWATILNIRDELLEKFDENSRELGLKVPEHRCWCGKEAKSIWLRGDKEIWVCNKHKKED